MSVVEYNKICKHCNELKSIELFGKLKTSNDGKASICFSCKRDYDKKWRALNSESYKKSCSSWRTRKPKSAMITSVKSRAKKFNIPFNVTEQDFEIPEYCPILGLKLKEVQIGKLSRNSPSMDKIIPELGYIRGNVRVISHLANTMKQDASLEELKLFCVNILDDISNREKGIN